MYLLLCIIMFDYVIIILHETICYMATMAAYLSVSMKQGGCL